jgi:vacuolar protein sorting-associated protein 13B
MFKIESYITPIILSYVDKYVKNVRVEDSQISLWGGDVVFQNLDLKLDVLEEELQLPFNFLSGHIHELSIHVPWTKIASEPIAITINTIGN